MPTPRASTPDSQLHMNRRQWIGLAVAAVLFLIPFIVEFPGLSPQGHRIFGIFLMAIVLWITEAVPLHATATIIILLEILLISDMAILPPPEGFAPPPFRTYFATLADPVLMLFLGGFFLADGAARFDLDRNLARVLLRPFGESPRMIVLGLMLITAVFSMFMSNTATTATLLAVVLPVIRQLPPGDRMRTGLALCIPIAANVGGMGTPIGTPPNAIALGALAQAGIGISFIQWMLMAVPLMVVVLLAAWLLITRLFPCGESRIVLNIDCTFAQSRSAWIFYCTAALTILLWLTEPLHGLSSSVVGFVPVMILLSTRVFGAKDLQSIQWHVLWLVAGGIALGAGVGHAGLDRWLIGLIGWEQMSPLVLVAMLSLTALTLSTVISNSATANLLIPIGLSLGVSEAAAISPILAGVFIAIGCSLAMALPISTPPNAIAISTGAVRTPQLAMIGVLVGLLGWLLFVLAGPPLWRLLGILPT